MLRRVITFIFLLTGISVQSQDYQKKIDSLNTCIVNTSGTSQLTIVFDKLSQYSNRVPQQIGFEKALVTLSYAKANKEIFAHFLAMRNLSHLYAYHQQKVEALQYMQEGLSYVKEKADSFTIALSYYHSVEFFKQQQLLPTALENLLEAISLFEKLNNHRYNVLCRDMAAKIHFSARNYIQAIDEALLVVEHYQKIPSTEEKEADEFLVMSTYNTMGLCYYKIKQFDKALTSYQMAEEIANRLKSEFWVGLINGNRAKVYKGKKLFKEALNSLQQDYRISKKFNENESAARAVISIAEIYMKLDSSIVAEQYLDSAELLITAHNRFELLEFWKVEALLRNAKGDGSGAFESQLRYSNLRDSMNNEAEWLNLTKVKANYELESKQREIKQLELINQQSRNKILLQNAIITASAIIFILLLILITSFVLNFRKLRKVNTLIKMQHEEIEYKNDELEAQSHKLMEANNLTQSLNNQLAKKVQERTHDLEVALHELDTFLYRSSHDMRRPLSTLMGLENIAKLETSDASILHLFEMVADTARQMDSMLLKMQMAYDLEREKEAWEVVSLTDLLKDQTAKFNLKFTTGCITFDNGSSNPVLLHSNFKWLTIIFKNILENAINFRKPKMVGDLQIHLHVYDSEEQVQVVITDNGSGIETAYLPKIFDQYFKGTDVSRGNGLGLFLVKKAVEKLKGEIEVRSEAGIGTTFIVTFSKLPLQIS